MAFGIAEDPARSVVTHLDEVDYPAWREQLVRTAEENDAPAEVINLLKSMPRSRYETRVEALRDLAEAARRFGAGVFGREQKEDGVSRDRRNIGRDAVQGV